MAGGTNLYEYAGSNPVGFSDPFGLTADTLKANGADAQRALDECRGNLACAAETAHWDADAAVITVHVSEVDGQGKAVKVGHLSLGFEQGPTGRRVTDGDVYLNPASYSDPRWVAQSGGAIDHPVALGHELREARGMQDNFVRTGNADQGAAHRAARALESAIRIAGAVRSILGF